MKTDSKLQAIEWADGFERTTKTYIRSITVKLSPLPSSSLAQCYDIFIKNIEQLVDGNHSKELGDTVKDIETLEKILSAIKSPPKHRISEVRKILNCEEKALESFIEAFKMGVVWASDKKRGDLHAVMTYQFSKSYKWWAQSNTLISAFINYNLPNMKVS